jgi:hypothetical protein
MPTRVSVNTEEQALGLSIRDSPTFSDAFPDDHRLNVFHRCSDINPRLQARVLPARTELVTILIAQMSDLLAPISKSTTRT